MPTKFYYFLHYTDHSLQEKALKAAYAFSVTHNLMLVCLNHGLLYSSTMEDIRHVLVLE